LFIHFDLDLSYPITQATQIKVPKFRNVILSLCFKNW